MSHYRNIYHIKDTSQRIKYCLTIFKTTLAEKKNERRLVFII